MATRMTDMGMDKQINRRLDSKYDPSSEEEVITWINALTGENLEPGKEKVQAALKNGHILIKLVNAVYDGTAQLPPAAAKKKRPFKPNALSGAFKQMENIQIFLNAATAYGVPTASCFATVDLYESRNMAQVLNTVLQLGTECQRNKFSGPTCGPIPTYENVREFSADQLAESKKHIGLQAGTNKFATQSGMSSGVRHIADIKVDAPVRDGGIGLQMGSNKGASQSGMSMGAVRHISDIKVEAASKESQGIIGAQMGWNQGDSQKGMARGGPRGISDIKVDAASKESQGIIGAQMGWNQGESQKGMARGGPRGISDMKIGTAVKDSHIGGQMGFTGGASQAGMSHGGQRHITDIKVGEAVKDDQIGAQMGWNKGATQAGMSSGGQRHISDIKVGEMSQSGKDTIGLQMGSNEGASQSGMSFGAQRFINDSH